jgi:molybdate transport system ATP-binding protein
VSSDRLSVKLGLEVGDFRLQAEFDVPPGITVLFGPSGAGKSTTLAAIAGLLKPDSGRIAFGDAVWFDSGTGVDAPPESREVSLVFQSLALFPHLTALQNVEYGISRAIPRAERRDLAAGMLARMKVGHVEGRKPKTFSGGEAQRVALARAFARKPRVVLLDEAFSAMDRDLRYELGGDIRGLVDELRIPTLLVTHHRMEARAVGNHAVFLRDGRVERTGPVRDVVPAPERERQPGA